MDEKKENAVGLGQSQSASAAQEGAQCKVQQEHMEANVQCTRCRHRHHESERQSVPSRKGLSHLVCPRCSGKSFYDLTPQAAWCWASGLIEFGDPSALPAGAITIATGPKSTLKGVLEVLARQGRGANEYKLLVPGVPEAETQQEKGDALAQWLKWCAKGNGRKGRHDVVFAVEAQEQAGGLHEKL